MQLFSEFKEGGRARWGDKEVTIKMIGKVNPDIFVVEWEDGDEKLTKTIRKHELVPVTDPALAETSTGAQDPAPAIDEPEVDPDDTTEVPKAFAQAVAAALQEPAADEEWVAFQKVHNPQTEITTLVQYIHKPEYRVKADTELAQHLNDGWSILNLSVLPGDEAGYGIQVIRVITLQRVKPAPAPERTTAHVAQEIYIPDAPLPGSVGETILKRALENLPIAQAIREHGTEAVIDAMNERAREAGRAAFEARLRGNRIFTTIPQLPENL